ncbi:hypothetical protein RRG08_055204 [Elysia crispata]|uniref:Uncharacterized protein n=1 Tax=Elysia crispata TaxID=231223 RepID=A0AAE0XSS7_9GAST|nr:hypothetical protein RRG08_055204 [Elysia crispata]
MDVNNDRKRKEELQLTPIMAQDMALYFRKLGTFETAEVAEVATFMRTVANSLPFIKHVYRDDIAKRWTISKADICDRYHHLANNQYRIGGPRVVAEFNESLIAKPKKNIGRVVEQRWNFGGVRPASGRGFKRQSCCGFVLDELYESPASSRTNTTKKTISAPLPAQRCSWVFQHLQEGVWDRCPKAVFVGRDRLEIAVFDATIVYNEGGSGRLDVFRKLGLSVGRFQKQGFRDLDLRRVKSAENQEKTVTKQKRARKTIRNAEEDFGDDDYEAGAF